VFGGAFFAGEALKVPGKSERQRVSEIVHGIGENRDAVGEDPTNYLNDRECEIEKERDFQVLAAVIMIVLAGHEVGRRVSGEFGRTILT
jgi:hypothetical protein